MSGAMGAVQAVRNLLWQHGFRPMPVYSPNHADRVRAGKAPLGKDWEKRARQDPPECVRLAAVVAWAVNTGILCDGLRAIDLDIDDPVIVTAVRALAVNMLGATIIRTRDNSPRCLLVYRAAEGEPAKVVITGANHGDGHACKIEVLGRGQQFVAYGGHPSGADLQWLDGGPADQDLADCPAITETKLHGFLNAVAPLIGAPPIKPTKSRPRTPANGQDHEPTVGLLEIAAALAAIPNAEAPDWEAWNNVGLAIFAATEGSDEGWGLWRDWSAKNPANDEDVTLGRWEHYAESPPDRTGAGKLFAMAANASPGWRRAAGLSTRRNGEVPPDPDIGEAPINVDVPPPGFDPGAPPPDGPGEGPGRRPQPDGLPLITCRAGELPRMVREAQAALLVSGIAIYQRGVLVQPVDKEYPAADGGTTHSAALVPMNAPSLMLAMAESATFQKWDARSEAFVECDPPGGLVQTVLHNRKGWPFATVRGVLTCPTIRPDGSVLSAPGYDPASRYFLMFPNGMGLPEIPDAPTKSDALESLTRLDILLDSYPFVDKPSRAVALAMLMTQVLRCAMPVSPLLGVSARAPGTGKSHLVDLASTVAVGRPVPAMGATSDEKETEKGIHTMLLSGVPGFSIDNVSRDLDTPTLNMATSQSHITIRLFGVLENVEVENATTIYITGNNLAIVDEQGRRTMRCDLDAGVERPERRHFHGDPIHAVRANRARYIADVLTIARAYHVSGENVAPYPYAGYGEWSHFVREPLVWLGMADPVDTVETTARDDPATLRLSVLLSGWWDNFASQPMTLADAARDAQPAFRDTLKEHFPARGGIEIDTTRMGNWLRKYGGRVAQKMRFVKDTGLSHSAVRWKIERV